MSDEFYLVIAEGLKIGIIMISIAISYYIVAKANKEFRDE